MKLVPLVAEEYGIRDAPSRRALFDAAHVTALYTGPFLLNYMQAMRPVARTLIAKQPDTRLLFVARGGTPLYECFAILEPQLIAGHGIHVSLSRVLVEAAIRDLERRKRLAIGNPAVRYLGKDIDDSLIDGAYDAVTRYLLKARALGGTSVIFDICHRATLQKMLQVLYSKTRFSGQYLFYEEAQGDPRPDTKCGYALHRRLAEPIGYGAAVHEGPLLAREEIMRAVEDTLNGPYSTTVRIVDGQPQRHLEAGLHHRMDLSRIDPVWKDENLRIAVKDLNLRVLRSLAHWVVGQKPATASYHLAAGKNNLLGQLHGFLLDDPRGDPAFRSVMSAHVPLRSPRYAPVLWTASGHRAAPRPTKAPRNVPAYSPRLRTSRSL
ncbi:MAG: hypothetical protein ACRDQZ_24365 [Mycobacteriales bacterium]